MPAAAAAARSFAASGPAMARKAQAQLQLRRVCLACHASGIRSLSSRSNGAVHTKLATTSRTRTPARRPATLSAASGISSILLQHQTDSKTTRRPYHSSDHPPSPGPFSRTEDAIFSAAHAHVPEHGFTEHALALGARDAGYPDVSATALPGGVFGLIRWHLVTRRGMLEARAAELFAGAPDPSSPADVESRAERLTWERLLANRAIISRWQQALAIMAQPSHAPAALKELAQLADDIWFLAGDVAVDPSWYTKRAALSAAYAASDLFMTNDRSADFHETREFLRRRLADASEVGGAFRSVGQWVGFTASAGLNVLRSKGARI